MLQPLPQPRLHKRRRGTTATGGGGTASSATAQQRARSASGGGSADMNPSATAAADEAEGDDADAPSSAAADAPPAPLPLFELVIVRRDADTDDEGSSRDLQYVSVRLMPLALSVDRSTIESLLTFTRPLRLASGAAAARAALDPAGWVRALTAASLARVPPLSRMAPAAALRAAALTTRVYVEQLVIHPVKLTLSFVQVLGGSSSGKNIAP